MDSGNSSSMQSSSGGDEEYDSRSESISAILNSSGHVGHGNVMSNPNLPTPASNPHHLNLPSSSPSSLFDPLSNYLDAFSRPPSTSNANSQPHLDMMWPRSLRSEPSCTEIGRIMGSSSSSHQISGAQRPSRGSLPSSSSKPLPTVSENSARPSAPPPSDQSNVVRSSKKRSRASRRAPTTVLTTDTSNFRAMVQEFTGIPAPPFSASPFPRSRLDLFNTASTLRSAHLDPPPPPYLLRPFAQKVQPPSFLSSAAAASVSSSFSSSLIDAIASSSNIGKTTTATNPSTATVTATTTTTIALATTNNTSNSTSTNNYQLLPDLGLPKQSQSILNIHQQNPVLTFQSLLQPSPLQQPKYPLANVFGEKSQQGSLSSPSTDSQQLKMGMVLEDFGMGHAHGNPQLSGLSNLVTSDGMSLRSDNNPSGWGAGVGLNDGDHQAHLKSFNVNYGNSQRVNSCKINYTTSSSDFHVDKGPENVSSRGEGMVDSWICSSD
ncbi:PREDICTED: verprolin-like [Nelumbo nucifera]|uniref:VQ domain-containing protein n=2 Tax=Nelumbo nucifera TaxID=4432 RepID=A0A822XSP7_NELNU|nr:PREDICTED: verprolin-like [Nelumbo nucifera]DAD21926.1 TPA_asm: hypothetical protein HUJ06_023389 [Nelumbo nucifera]